MCLPGFVCAFDFEDDELLENLLVILEAISWMSMMALFLTTLMPARLAIGQKPV